jgi:hypothetical protein
MAGNWVSLPIDSKVFTNVVESSLKNGSAALENAFINEAKGQSRFPGLIPRFTIPDGGRVYLDEWRFDLMAATSRGRLYRCNPEDYSTEDVTGVPISGGKRVTFARTEDELVMAAGREIIRWAGAAGGTELLSTTAPLASHVGYLDGFLIANEVESGRFYHSAAGQWRSWDLLDVFTAEAKPDNLSALLVTPYRELLVSGFESIEQWERLTDGSVPFFRRWAVGEGLIVPYSLVSADNGNWCINEDYEFVRFSGQSSVSKSDDVQRSLESIDDWTDAWADRIHISGQKFLVLQAPEATNLYGTKGITLLYDYRNGRWSNLFGWDPSRNLPARWPGWSHYQLGNRHWVGGEGVIYELDPAVFTNAGQPQRILYRSAHFDKGPTRIDDLKMRILRGDPANPRDPVPKVRVRVNKNNARWSRWVEKQLGKPGQRDMFITFGAFGDCDTFQVELEFIADARFELASMWADLTRLVR